MRVLDLGCGWGGTWLHGASPLPMRLRDLISTAAICRLLRFDFPAEPCEASGNACHLVMPRFHQHAYFHGCIEGGKYAGCA